MENKLSISVKQSLAKHLGFNAFEWNIETANCTEKMFSIPVKTKHFLGNIIFFPTPSNHSFCFTYVSFDEANRKSDLQLQNLLSTRTNVLAEDNLVDFISKIGQKVFVEFKNFIHPFSAN